MCKYRKTLASKLSFKLVNYPVKWRYLLHTLLSATTHHISARKRAAELPMNEGVIVDLITINPT